MARHNQVAIRCSIEANNCYKGDPDGNGTLVLTYPVTELDNINKLQKGFGHRELIVVFSKAS